MLVVFGLGVVLWLVYGLELHASPIIAANVVTLGLICWLLHLKFRYGHKRG
jgi:MtN3 and saliva related transmembrane protein